MNYKAVIFDLDGTILDTLEDLTASMNYALVSCGYPERSMWEIRSFVGNGIHMLIERAVPKGEPTVKIEKVFAVFNDHYTVHCADNTKPYEGVVEVILSLRKQGIKTAVVSNKADYAVQVLCKQYFNGLFDIAVGEKQGVGKKPCPDSVNEVMHELKLDRAKAIYIGDSEVDIQTAKNAGIECICVDWGFRDKDYLISQGAAVTVTNSTELLKAIQRS